jgi:hypothetical protein
MIPAVRRNPLVLLAWRLHRWLYRLSAGRLGALLLGWPVILLTTTGRKSGRPRTVALHALLDGDRYIVAASNAGEPRHPEWYLNLRADRLATVQHGLWTQITSRDRSYAEYQSRTDREIPVVILEPSGDVRAA